jgi:hypothetical protein
MRPLLPHPVSTVTSPLQLATNLALILLQSCPSHEYNELTLALSIIYLAQLLFLFASLCILLLVCISIDSFLRPWSYLANHIASFWDDLSTLATTWWNGLYQTPASTYYS